jgi:hypothetical protein
MLRRKCPPLQEFDRPDHGPKWSTSSTIEFPTIVKPFISYASIDVSMISVDHSPEKMLEQNNLSLIALLSRTIAK